MRKLPATIRAWMLPPLAAAALGAHAQSADQFTAWGDKAMALGQHYGASRYYAEALEKAPGLMELQWKYAEACRQSNQYGEAALFYDKVQKKDHARNHPEALRWLAEMQMCSGQYDEAQTTWAKTMQKERKKDSFIAQRAANGLEGCKLAKRLLNDPDHLVTIEHLPMPVNTFSSEFGARTGPDSALYFTSLRGPTTADGRVKDTADYRARIFRTTQADGNWNEPAALPANVNNGRNNANCAWSGDGRWFYFSREEAPGQFSIRAVDAHRANDTGAVVLRMPGYTVTQPMVADFENTETLFFASNMPGGQGGMDIWWGTLVGKDLINPKPLGPPVNTPGNEVTPFLDGPKGMLYFSSDFLPGMGGYDLFKSLLGHASADMPINMGVPFNSPANDLYPAVYNDGSTGWVTSNRTGSFAEKGATCCNDLYRFSYPTEAPAPAPVATHELDTLPYNLSGLDTAAMGDGALKRLTSLREKLPIRLYFHNDEPDPRSWSTTTPLDYAETFRSYQAHRPEYDSAWRATAEENTAFDTFFRSRVEGGFAQLNDFIALLQQALGEGQRIKLTIRGYASPLAKSDYNRNLSLRRISSLMNYLRITGHGALAKYLDGTAENGARLTILERPFGKETAATTVSDRLDDLRNSVYSVGAAMERRIEIEQVE